MTTNTNAALREKLIDLIAETLSGTYHCTRVWAAWGVGTMSQDDFEDVGESDTPAELADAILALLAAAPAAQAAPAAVAGPVAYRVLRKRHDGEWVTDGRAWCDGVPTQDLVDDIALRSDGWRIEYAFAAPTTQEAPPQEAQEPVAWQGVHDQTDLYYTKPLQADVRPLYAAPQPAPVAQGDALPREDFAWLVVQEACETEPADEDDPECIRILRRDLKSAVLAAFLRHDAARTQAKEGGAP